VSSSDQSVWIGDHQPRLGLRGLRKDALNAGLGERLHAVDAKAQALRAPGDLGEALLTGDIKARHPRGHGRNGLQ
jgi:hypothetical protein